MCKDNIIIFTEPQGVLVVFIPSALSCNVKTMSLNSPASFHNLLGNITTAHPWEMSCGALKQKSKVEYPCSREKPR